jgi:wobble nucleotide-excising tRNase
MRIKKLSKIDNIFSYSFFNWNEMNPEHGGNPNTPDDDFKKENVIFAENGNGKSAMVNILKSLDGQKINLEKNWDRPNDDQEIKIVLADDCEINFNGICWSDEGLKENFLIFDEYFIESFVHSIGPDTVDTPKRRQQRGRNIVYLGNFAEYNREIERINGLKDTIKEKNQLFLETENAKVDGLISRHGITTEDLVLKKDKILELNKNDLNNKKDKLLKYQAELEKIKKAISEKSSIESLPIMSESNDKFSLNTEIFKQGKKIEISLDPVELFSFTVAKGVQKTLDKIANKKNFIKEGLSLLTDNTKECPFCEQKIKNGDYIDIIKNYQEIFDENFVIEEKRVSTSLLKYKEILENLKELQAPSVNQNNLKQIKPFISIEWELPFLDISDEDKELIKTELSLVNDKEKNILEKISKTNINKISKIIDKANKSIGNYNEIVKKINKKINKLKKDSREGNLDNVKNQIINKTKQLQEDILLIENKESFEKYFKAIEINNENKKVIDSLERVFQTLKIKIIEEFNKFVEDYFGVIKNFIKEISPSMEIFNISGQATYDRRNVNEPAQCGFYIKYNNKECSSNLSKGEKQVIALAFFFAQLRKEVNKNKDKVIVLDDPITSFDAGKRKSTAEVIQRETKDFEQLFVLTCDPLFKEYCRKQFNNRNLYYIFKTKGFSSIHYITKKRETIYSSFENEFKNIESIQGTNENVVIYGQKLRFCLETKIKEDYFGYSEDNLSSMIDTVTRKKKEEFEKLFDNKDSIIQIYNYCNTGGLAHYPRDGSTSWNELKDKIRQYLSLGL